MTTLDILVGIVVIGGIVGVSLMVTILIKLNSVAKTVKENSTMLKKSETNMVKVTKLLDILLRRTKNSNMINSN